MPFPSYFIPRKNGVLAFGVIYRVMDAALGPAKVKFQVTYSDGTLPTTQAVNLAGTAPMGDYDFLRKNFHLASSKVAGLSIIVPFKSTVGTLLINEGFLIYQATASTREAVLPVPLAAVK